MTRFDVARTQQPKSTAAYGSLRFGPLRYQLKRTIGMLPTPDNSECSRQFPDSVTARGAKHLDELARMAHAGHRAVMLYLVQRTDCDRFTLAHDIDPTYAQAFRRARAAGVETLCLGTHISPSGVDVATPILIEIDGPCREHSELSGVGNMPIVRFS